MLVETFECEEVSSEQPEMESEAVALVESLGLKGQAELLRPTESGNEKRVPYRQCTQLEWFVIRMLCPEKFDVEKFNASPIPLRVLQTIAYCRAESYFDELVIYDKTSAEIKDPFLVGIVGPSYSPKQRFLLARWGEELEEWPALAKRALASWREQMKETAAEVIAEAQQMFARIDSMGIDAASKKSSAPSIYWS